MFAVRRLFDILCAVSYAYAVCARDAVYGALYGTC